MLRLACAGVDQAFVCGQIARLLRAAALARGSRGWRRGRRGSARCGAPRGRNPSACRSGRRRRSARRSGRRSGRCRRRRSRASDGAARASRQDRRDMTNAEGQRQRDTRRRPTTAPPLAGRRLRAPRSRSARIRSARSLNSSPASVGLTPRVVRLEQAPAEITLEPRDTAADDRLGDAEALRGAAETAGIRSPRQARGYHRARPCSVPLTGNNLVLNIAHFGAIV